MLLWLGVGLFLVGFGLWWRETRPVALHAAERGVGDAVVPADLPAAGEDQVQPNPITPTLSARPTVTPAPADTVVVETMPAVVPSPTVTETPPPTATPAGPPPASQPPTRIVAPAIGLDANVVPMGWKTRRDANGNSYSEWVVPAFAAGWHINSALPGTPGNVVLSGHNNIDGEVFRYVSDLKPGDQVTLYVGDQPYQYTVAEKLILPEKGQPYEVRLKNAQYIAQTSDDRLTLVTCWPYTSNTHRVIVIARPVE